MAIYHSMMRWVVKSMWFKNYAKSVRHIVFFSKYVGTSYLLISCERDRGKCIRWGSEHIHFTNAPSVFPSDVTRVQKCSSICFIRVMLVEKISRYEGNKFHLVVYSKKCRKQRLRTYRLGRISQSLWVKPSYLLPSWWLAWNLVQYLGHSGKFITGKWLVVSGSIVIIVFDAEICSLPDILSWRVDCRPWVSFVFKYSVSPSPRMQTWWRLL